MFFLFNVARNVHLKSLLKYIIFPIYTLNYLIDSQINYLLVI